MRINGFFLVFIFIIACKTIDDDVSLDEHLSNLMNKRDYSAVIASIEALPKDEQASPKRLLFLSQAYSGKAGIDLVSLAGFASKSMDVMKLENSFARLLRVDGVAPESQKASVATVKSLVSFVGSVQILNSLPRLHESSRPLLMASLVALQQISANDGVYYRKARTQSFMMRSAIMLASLKSALKPGDKPDIVSDLFCVVDGAQLAKELPWMTDHLVGALEDAIELRKLSTISSNSASINIDNIYKKAVEIRSNPSKYRSAAAAVEIAASQSMQCN